jgi:hypothetical protein
MAFFSLPGAKRRVTQVKPSGDKRLAPEVPFPPYAFVPGRRPHPTSDPAGHSYGAEPDLPAPIEPAHWEASTPYRYGLDLFNHQFYWESHVQFESLWLAAGRKGLVADFLKGLIKLAAAGVKHLEGKPQGVRSHACRAAELWRGVGLDVFLGLRLRELIELAERVGRQGWPATPVLLLPDFV